MDKTLIYQKSSTTITNLLYEKNIRKNSKPSANVGSRILESQHLIYKHQNGFSRNHLTADALIHMESPIQNAFLNRQSF